MGCLCPRKLPYAPPINNNPDPRQQQHTYKLQDIPLESERNQIIPQTTRKSNLSNLEMFSHLKSSYPAERPNPNKTNTLENKMTQSKSYVSGIVVSQFGGSKLNRSISIISTDADILGIEEFNFNGDGSVMQEIVIVANGFQKKQKLKKINKKYYSLIESKLYVKKDANSITKIKSPSGQSSFFCRLQTIRETIHLSDGIPIQNIKILTQHPISYLIEQVYPLSINIKFQCCKCRNKKIQISSSCKIKLDMKCKCGSSEFRVTNIQTSPDKIPLWYEGEKLLQTKFNYIKNSQIRAIGCNICWRFEECSAMQCGCLRCSSCSFEHANDRCILCL